jgi:glycosyltransferase involved in cell wall biosynthesis
MTENKTIFIAHNWQDNSLNRQSKEMALYFSEKNKVFFLHAGNKNIPAQQVNKNLLVVKWPGKRPTGLKDLFFALKLMRRNKPGIVISNFGANNIMLFAGWITGAERRICYYHTLVSQYIADNGKLGLRQRLNIVRKNFFWRKATHILASSHAAKNDILKYYNVNEGNIYIFPNALPDKHVVNKGQVNKIGFIGRLHRSKGVDILIEAFYRLSLEIPGLQLSIAGSGEEKPGLESRAETLGIKSKVVFEGNVPNDEICNFISGLNFLVVPSRMDNLPTVVLEAFSTGTPVVATRAGGIPDMVEHEKTGLLFENEDVEGLYMAMKRLMNDSGFWRELSANAKTKFIEQ